MFEQPYIVRSFDRRRRRERDIVYATAVAPANATGEYAVRLPGSPVPIVVSSGIGNLTFKPGALVPLAIESGDGGYVIVAKPAPGRKGASGFPLAEPVPGQLDTFGIVSGSPASLVIGEADQDVTLTGFNFVSGDLFRAVLFSPSMQGYIADPYATVHDVTFVSPTEVTAQVDVDADAPPSVGGRRYVTIEPRRAWEVA